MLLIAVPRRNYRDRSELIQLSHISGSYAHFSADDFREPIERSQAALHKTPERIALPEIGETFALP